MEARFQAGDVAEVVASVGEQRQRVGTPAVEGLDRDEEDVDDDADREGAVVIDRAVRVAAVRMVMARVVGAGGGLVDVAAHASAHRAQRASSARIASMTAR
jgi:hypothetical protein